MFDPVESNAEPTVKIAPAVGCTGPLSYSYDVLYISALLYCPIIVLTRPIISIYAALCHSPVAHIPLLRFVYS